MRPLRYSINVTLDGCVDHMAGMPNEGVHRNARENIERSDGLLLGRVTYEMMEGAWRGAASAGRPAWMLPFAKVMDAAKKYVVSSTLASVDWSSELVRGDLATEVRKLKAQPGKGLGTGGVRLPTALAELGLIDEYEIVTHPRVAGHGPYLLAGLSKILDLHLRESVDLGDGVVARRYVPR